jgi:hypothetical protein
MELENAIDQMKQIEKDLLNKGFDKETFAENIKCEAGVVKSLNQLFRHRGG